MKNSYNISFAIVLGGDLVKSPEHLGVAYLTAVLREAGYTVSIIELRDIRDIDKLLKHIEKNQVDMLGFSTTCINIGHITALSKQVKEAYPAITLACGGHGVTFKDIEALSEIPSIDIVIRGEAEETIVELVQKLEKKLTLKDVRGVTFRDVDTGEIVRNEERPLLDDLDKLPFPSRDQFEQHNGRISYMRLCSSRGCYGNCAYCSAYIGRKQEGPRWRGRSPKNVVDEIEFLVKKYDFHTFDFVDSTFEDPPNPKGKERAGQIAQEIIDRGLEIFYNCCFRAENWSESDHDLLDTLVESGLEKINIGFEAGNNKLLKLLCKRATVEDNYRALSVIKQHPEIYITFGYLFYHPYVDFNDLRDNARFLYNTGIGQVTRHYLWPLEIYPSTTIKDRLIKDGLLKEGGVVYDIYSYDFVYPEVGMLAKHMVKYLKHDIIWDYEIFDIVLHTYITRLLRKFKQNKEAADLVNEFWTFVNQKRSELAAYNYEFITTWIDTAEGGWTDTLLSKAESLDICKIITENKAMIQDKQLRLSRTLHSMGIRLTGR